MMEKLLSGRKILVLAEDLYEDLELWYPVLRFQEEGAQVVLAGTGREEYTGKNGHAVRVDTEVDRVQSEDFDALIIPGGYAPDHLRRYPSRGQGGFSTKVHLRAEGGGKLITLVLTPGQCHEAPVFPQLMTQGSVKVLRADPG
jgi:hypothetical protein